MDRSDYVCDYLKYLREIQTDCCDYSLYECEKYNVVFDEFHDRCDRCKDNTCKDGGSMCKTIETVVDLNKILEQLEDYGKYKGLLRCEEDRCENYIPVSVAKQIVKGRGLSEY